MPYDPIAPDDRTPAVVGQAIRVLSGVYTVSYPAIGEDKLKVHTITQARTEALVGKRVISHWNYETEQFEAFAFLTVAGTVKVWQRFREQRGASYVRLAEMLCAALQDDSEFPYGPSVNFPGFVASSFTPACHRCNHQIRSRLGWCSRHNPNEERSEEEYSDEDASDSDDDYNEESSGRSMVTMLEVPASNLALLPRSQITPGIIQ